jgi:hypothetical protein
VRRRDRHRATESEMVKQTQEDREREKQTQEDRERER